MIELAIDLFFITIIIVFIIDISGAIISLKKALCRLKLIKHVYDPIKPFDCSLCMTWWCGILYMFFFTEISLFGLFLLSIFSAVTSAISPVILLFIDAVKIMTDKFYSRQKNEDISLNKNGND